MSNAADMSHKIKYWYLLGQTITIEGYAHPMVVTDVGDSHIQCKKKSEFEAEAFKVIKMHPLPTKPYYQRGRW